jgi:hypothetical protein
MPDFRRNPYVPWISAAVVGAAFVALLLVYVVILRPDERHADDQRAAAKERTGQLTATEKAAMNAAGTEMVNLVTFSRDHFEADYQRAVDGATGSLRSDVQGKRAETLKAMTDGKFDLFGRLTHKALEDQVTSNGKTGYVVLVTINGFRSSAPQTPIQQNLAVTVINVDGKWLANDVRNIGVEA